LRPEKRSFAANRLTAEASSQGAWITLLKRRLFLPTGWLRLFQDHRRAGAAYPDIHAPDGGYVIKVLGEFPLLWTDRREYDLQNNAQR